MGKVVPAVITSGTEFITTEGMAKIWGGNNRKYSSNMVNTIIV